MAWIEEIVTIPYYLTPGWRVTVHRNTGSVSSAMFDNTEQSPANQDIYDAVNAYVKSLGWNWMGYPRGTQLGFVTALKDLPRVKSVEVTNLHFHNGVIYRL